MAFSLVSSAPLVPTFPFVSSFSLVPSFSLRGAFELPPGDRRHSAGDKGVTCLSKAKAERRPCELSPFASQPRAGRPVLEVRPRPRRFWVLLAPSKSTARAAAPYPKRMYSSNEANSDQCPSGLRPLALTPYQSSGLGNSPAPRRSGLTRRLGCIGEQPKPPGRRQDRRRRVLPEGQHQRAWMPARRREGSRSERPAQALVGRRCLSLCVV